MEAVHALWNQLLGAQRSRHQTLFDAMVNRWLLYQAVTQTVGEGRVLPGGRRNGSRPVAGCHGAGVGSA
jgi:cellobiose phosphorylase